MLIGFSIQLYTFRSKPLGEDVTDQVDYIQLVVDTSLEGQTNKSIKKRIGRYIIRTNLIGVALVYYNALEDKVKDNVEATLEDLKDKFKEVEGSNYRRV